MLLWARYSVNCSGLCPVRFWISPRTEILCNLYQCSTNLAVKICFLTFRWNFCVFQSVPIASVLSSCLIAQPWMLHKCRWVKSFPCWQSSKARGNVREDWWLDWSCHQERERVSAYVSCDGCKRPVLRMIELWSELRIWMVKESCGQLLLLLPQSAQREMELNNKFSELCPPLSVKFRLQAQILDGFWIF